MIDDALPVDKRKMVGEIFVDFPGGAFRSSSTIITFSGTGLIFIYPMFINHETRCKINLKISKNHRSVANFNLLRPFFLKPAQTLFLKGTRITRIRNGIWKSRVGRHIYSGGKCRPCESLYYKQ
jgi:hypothetical protein